ncbi:hypothetical protein D3C87_1455110 [compost metagenome]
MGAPGVQASPGDVRCAAVIQDEGYIRRCGGQLTPDGKLVMSDAEVKAQARGGQAPDILHKEIRLAQGVRHRVKHAAQADNTLDAEQLVELSGEILGFGAAGCDGARNAGQGKNKFGLGQNIGLGHVHFHVEGGLDAQVPGFGPVGFNGPWPVQGGGAIEPGIRKALRIDQVQVGINNRNHRGSVRKQASLPAA